MAQLFKLGPRGYHASVNKYQGQIRIHIRKHVDFCDAKDVPTRYGITLNIHEFQELKKLVSDLSDIATKAMLGTPSTSEKEAYRRSMIAALFNLGSRGYYATVQYFKGQTLIHIRKYEYCYRSYAPEMMARVPTKCGVGLTFYEFQELKKAMPSLSEAIRTMQESGSVTIQQEVPDTKSLPEKETKTSKKRKPEENGTSQPRKKKVVKNIIPTADIE